MQIGLGITVPKMGILGGDAGVGLGVGFFPGNLFLTGAQGAWYDPSDYSTLYQDANGTTPVTAVEQPVRLMLDRSKGLVLGGELWGTPALSGSSWAWDGLTLTGLGVTTGTATGSAVVAGRSYRITLTVSATGSGLFQVRVGTTFIATLAGGANTTYTYIVAATSTTGLEFTSSGGTTGTITNISCRELPGNHATAPNDASRPVLRSRYNQLTFSEQFDNAAWTKTRATVTANAGVAPDGTTTADTFTEDSTASSTHVVTGPSSGAPSYTTAATVTASIFVKIAFGTRNVAIRVAGNNGSAVAIYNPSTGAFVTSTTTGTNWTFVSSSVTALADGWYRITCTGTHTETSGGLQLLCNLVDNSNLSYTGDGTSGILIWGAQLLTAADQTSTGGAYQRIAAATDYDTSNPVWRPYLAFDGSDDSLSTSSIDFSGTDEMTVFAGVTKLSDAAGSVVLGHGVDDGTVGAFEFRANTAVNATTAFRGRSSAGSTATAGFTRDVAAPSTFVFASLVDYAAAAGAEFSGRYNGVVQAQNVGLTQENTGTFGNNVLTIGSRQGGALQRFNGRLYSLAVLGRTATAAELGAMEAWVAGKTGVTI